MRVNLLVPYVDKDVAKRRGAKWDKAKGIWYIEDHPRMELFLKWIPDELKVPVK